MYTKRNQISCTSVFYNLWLSSTIQTLNTIVLLLSILGYILRLHNYTFSDYVIYLNYNI